MLYQPHRHSDSFPFLGLSNIRQAMREREKAEFSLLPNRKECVTQGFVFAEYENGLYQEYYKIKVCKLVPKSCNSFRKGEVIIRCNRSLVMLHFKKRDRLQNRNRKTELERIFTKDTLLLRSCLSTSTKPRISMFSRIASTSTAFLSRQATKFSRPVYGLSRFASQSYRAYSTGSASGRTPS